VQLSKQTSNVSQEQQSKLKLIKRFGEEVVASKLTGPTKDAE